MMTNQTCASCLYTEQSGSKPPCDTCEDSGNWKYREEKSCDTCAHEVEDSQENCSYCTLGCCAGEMWRPKTNEPKPKQQACRTCIHAAKSGHEEPCNDCYGTGHYKQAETPAYIHEVEVSRYECPKCGKQYDTREKAEQCYAHWQLLEAYKKCEPWRWYMLTGEDGRVKWIFAKKVFQYVENSVWTRGSCRDTHFAIDDCFFNDRYNTRNWTISADTMSLIEGYTQEKRIPRIKSSTYGKRLPPAVFEDLKRLEEIVRKECGDRILARPLTEIIETAIEDEFKKVWP